MTELDLLFYSAECRSRDTKREREEKTEKKKSHLKTLFTVVKTMFTVVKMLFSLVNTFLTLVTDLLIIPQNVVQEKQEEKERRRYFLQL